MDAPPGRTVRVYLLFIAAICTVPLAIFGGYFAYQVALEAADRRQSDLEERLTLLRSAMEQRIDRVAAQLQVLAHSPDLMAGDLNHVAAHAREAVRLIGGITVLLADRDGNQIFNTRQLPPGKAVPRRRDLEAQNRAWETKLPQVSDLYPATVDAQPVISVEVPVIDDAGEVKYMLAAGILSNSFADLMDQYVPPDAIGSIIDRKGTLIARRPNEAGLVGKKTIPQVLAHIGEAHAFGIATVSRDGVPSYSSILRSPTTGWTVDLALPRSAIDAPLRETAFAFLIAGLVTLAIGLLLARVISERFLRAFATLQDHVRRLASHELVAPVRGPVTEINGMDETLHQVGAQLVENAQRHQVLLDEVNHRVKNTLATIQAIARLSLARAPDLPSYYKSLEARLLALSAAYNLLTQSNWQGVAMHDIVARILEPFSPAGRVAIAGPDVVLKPRLALAFAAAVQELCTNAAKYGALSVPSGKVDVSWRRDAAALTFVWTERDGPAVAPPTRKGFGTRFLEDVLGRDTSWKAEIDYAPSGLTCRFFIVI